MNWIAIAAIAWVVLASLLAVVIGRGIRLADKREAPATAQVVPS